MVKSSHNEMVAFPFYVNSTKTQASSSGSTSALSPRDFHRELQSQDSAKAAVVQHLGELLRAPQKSRFYSNLSEWSAEKQLSLLQSLESFAKS